MADHMIGRDSLRPFQRARSHILRVLAPILGGGASGACLGLLGVGTNAISVGASATACGFGAGLMLVATHHHERHEVRYYADWFLLFGACIAASLLGTSQLVH